MPTFHRLPTVVLAAALTLLVLGSPLAWAQSYPTKPIRIIVPFGAGGIADYTARAVAQKMSESLRQPVVIENRPGAGGIVASQAVATAEPDGHTLLLMSNGNAVSAGLFKSLPYDTVKDFAPISTLGFFDIALVTKSDSRFATLGEFLHFTRANPGKANIGTINIGSTQNLAGELFKSSAGVDAQIVPFNGTPALMSAVLVGSVDVAVEILGPVMPQVAARSMRVLALMGDKRRDGMPDVPTVQESGIANFNVASWNALAAPARTPRDIIALLNREVQAAVNAPAVKARLAELGVEARSSTPEHAQELLASEIMRWTDVIARAGIERQ
ncbi:MAG: Bug family tripartite tricarboxylate transporter substrate binding protein [Usitatibacter sp.]